MKKCLIMFTILFLTLVVAALTEKKQEAEGADDIAMGEEINDDIAFEQTLPVSNEEIKNE